MCGRYGRRADKQRIAEWFRTHDTDVFNEEYYETNAAHFTPSYNISPESMQPVVRVDRDTGDRVLALMKWGLCPIGRKRPEPISAPSMRGPTNSPRAAHGASRGSIAAA